MPVRKYKSVKKPKDSNQSIWRLFFLLPVFEALAAIALIFSSPSEGGSAWLLGLSLTRWGLVAGLIVLGGLFAALYWLDQREYPSGLRIAKTIQANLQKPIFYGVLIAVLSVVSILALYLILLAFKFTDALVQARLQRLLPILVWLFAFSLQTLILAPRLQAKASVEKFQAGNLWAPFTVSAISLALVSLFVLATGLGLKPDRTGWDNPGVPLMTTQVFIALMGAALVYGILYLVRRFTNWKISRLDLIAAGLLWLVAFVAWQSEPLTPTYFSPTPQPPNYDFYPYSDAASHDLVAQNLMVGEGFTSVSEKPLYSFFLAVLHALVGQDYLRVVAVQIAVLALFPVTLYFLSSRLHHRFSGLILGLAVILRERNAIALSGEINVSHSKLLMTDMPTALALGLFCILLLRWFSADKNYLRWPLWVGASLGFLLLLRSQTIILLPVLLVVALWLRGDGLRRRLVYASVLLLGFALAYSPWLLRNYAHTGQFGYSQPLQALYMAKQYSLTPEANDPGFPQGTPTSEYVSLGFSKVLDFTLQYPAEVARFVSAHFFHNEVSSLLALPIRFDLSDRLVTYYDLLPYWEGTEDRLWSECCSLNAHIAGTPYWRAWDGIFPSDAWLPIAINLALIALGIAAAWKRVGTLALVPVGLHVLYNLSTAIARVSGWRLALPVDWVLIVYYCLGIGQLCLGVWFYFFGIHRAKEKKQRKERRSTPNWREERLPQYAAAIFLAALLLPVTEIVVPDRYPELDRTTAANQWRQADFAEGTPLDPDAFLDQPGAVAVWGRALYPRYYVADLGEPGGQWPAFNPLPFSRLGFVLVGTQSNHVVLPLQEATAAFPNASDVLVLACREENYLRAVGVVFLENTAPDLLSDFHTFSCEPAD